MFFTELLDTFLFIRDFIVKNILQISMIRECSYNGRNRALQENYKMCYIMRIPIFIKLHILEAPFETKVLIKKKTWKEFLQYLKKWILIKAEILFRTEVRRRGFFIPIIFYLRRGA
jgi:hypothetical protein